MHQLSSVLRQEGYKKITFKLSKTQHLFVKAKVNGSVGTFILDTGASSSCIAHSAVEFFQLHCEPSSTKASGAGAVNMETQVAHYNTLQMGRWKVASFSFVVFDLSHVNEALQSYKTPPVHGIIGADVLLQGKAIIDYAHHILYLR